ncbi:MAG TPA: hypothetical protein VGH10_03480 [Actinomycetota bacterium]|jgi:hypothetical protein
MAVEAATFGVASFLHFDGSIPLGFQTVVGESAPRAAIPEAIIGAVLAAGAIVAFAAPARARPWALAATWFAVAGTTLGLTIVVAGRGPHSVPDIAYHASILAVLVAGLIGMLAGIGSRPPGDGDRVPAWPEPREPARSA